MVKIKPAPGQGVDQEPLRCGSPDPMSFRSWVPLVNPHLAAAEAVTQSSLAPHRSGAEFPQPMRNIVEFLLRAAARDPSGRGRTALPVAWASSRGAERTENQDRLIVGRSATGASFAILADGMGGMKDGGRAAALSVAVAAAYLGESTDVPIDHLLLGALHAANREVHRLLRGAGGAALVAAVWHEGVCLIGHAGDARAYAVTGTDPVQLKQMTSDDTLDAELSRLGRRRAPDPDVHRGLVQFIGIGPDLDPHITQIPDRVRAILLVSDGINQVPLPTMEWIVRNCTSLQLLPERLVTASDWGGGRDNATVIAIGTQGSDLSAPPGHLEYWVATEHLAVVAEPRLGISFDEPAPLREKKQPGRASRTKRGRGPRKGKQQRSDPHTPASDLPPVAFEISSPPPTSDSPKSPPESGSRPNPKDSPGGSSDPTSSGWTPNTLFPSDES